MVNEYDMKELYKIQDKLKETFKEFEKGFLYQELEGQVSYHVENIEQIERLLKKYKTQMRICGYEG